METFKVHLPLLPLWPGVLLPVANISLHLLQQTPAPPARPGRSALPPMKAKLIAGEFAVRFRSVSEFYVVFGKRGNKQARSLASKHQICGSLLVPKDTARASKRHEQHYDE